MNDFARTGAYLGGAALLVVLALVSGPEEVSPEQFNDEGQVFYPEFTDPTKATDLEVISFDTDSGKPKTFRVAKNDKGVWAIPSHGGYPADAEKRMAQSATMLIGLTKKMVRSDSKKDHVAFGVVDPSDEGDETEGRGIRVVFRNAGGTELGQLIIGNEVDGKLKHFYVRVPGKMRTYVAEIDGEVSTKFADWIETDLLKAKSWEIDKIVFDNYSIDEQAGRIVAGEKLVVAKDDGSKWVLEGVAADKETDEQKVRDVTTALGGIKIVGVRPKPEGLTERLRQAQGFDQVILSQMLQNKGYFMVNDGSLRSNEGDLLFETTKGVRYTLRFGEIAYGDGDAVSAGGETDKPAEGEPELPANNRFLMVSAEFDKSLLKAPSGIRMLEEEWNKRVEARTAIEEIVAAVDSYRAANEQRMPESLEVLTQPIGDAEPLLKELKKDPWEQDYVLQPMGESFAVISYGADQKEGGAGIEQDIRSDAFALEDEIRKTNDEWTAYDTKVKEGEEEAAKLTKRFGPWYYVIDEELFGKLKPTRESLTKAKAEEATAPGDGR